MGSPSCALESGELRLSRHGLLRRPSCVSRRLLSNDTLKRITGKQFVATSPRLGDASSKDPTHGEHGDDTALIELNVLEFGLAEMAACIHDLTAPPLLQPLSTTWLVELYGALLGLCKQHAGGVEVAAELLRGLPILPLHRPAGASLLSSCDGDAVYRGLPAEYKAKGDVWRRSTLPNLRLLSAPMEAALDAAETAAPTQLLWILGVRPATDLVSHVLREHEATYAAGGDELGRIPSWRGRHRRLRAQLRLLRRQRARLQPGPAALHWCLYLHFGQGSHIRARKRRRRRRGRTKRKRRTKRRRVARRGGQSTSWHGGGKRRCPYAFTWWPGSCVPANQDEVARPLALLL